MSLNSRRKRTSSLSSLTLFDSFTTTSITSGTPSFHLTPTNSEHCIAISLAALTSSKLAPMRLAPAKCQLICRGVSLLINAATRVYEVSRV
ncbi:carboxymuconolactone decarboxylase [Moniliophthora roreri]|nr:carboxymuconolactone decarboxylase [Moniliophthora roreri]